MVTPLHKNGNENASVLKHSYKLPWLLELSLGYSDSNQYYDVTMHTDTFTMLKDRSIP